jgi:hypothetical protein
MARRTQYRVMSKRGWMAVVTAALIVAAGQVGRV